MIKPKALALNDRIGIIAPAGPAFNNIQLKESIEKIKSIGFVPIIGKSCYSKYGFLAGKDDIRAYDVNLFFKSKDIKGILSLRGGYGSIRILDKLDYKAIKDNPKVFMGYSDITAIHSAINRYSDLITFHGPMAYSDFYNIDRKTYISFLDNIVNTNKVLSYNIEPIFKKKDYIKGEMFGGNLCVLTSLLGSKYQVNYKGKILFIEDVNESPYEIDRMLHQLNLSGVFKKVKCVILGQFTNCTAKDKNKSHSTEYVFRKFFEENSIESYKGLEIGHEKSKITMPLGINCEVSENNLKLSEKGVR